MILICYDPEDDAEIDLSQLSDEELRRIVDAFEPPDDAAYTCAPGGTPRPGYG
jgi:hypothetical protein